MQRFGYTDDFDNQLKDLVRIHGKKWRYISDLLGCVVTEDAVRNRYMRTHGISPKPRGAGWTGKSRKRKFWTDEEDKLLAHAVDKYGMKWNLIRDKEFPTKTRQALRNRVRRMGLKFIVELVNNNKNTVRKTNDEEYDPDGFTLSFLNGTDTEKFTNGRQDADEHTDQHLD